MVLADYYDARCSGAPHTAEQLIILDQAELQVLIRICDGVLAMRRRLGGDATSDELAIDKKRAKRLAHCWRTSLRAWGAQESSSDVLEQEIRQRAATVHWEDLAAARRQYLLSRFPLYATMAIDLEEEQWGYHIITILKNELRWLDYAMR
jgi:hypothetical protein